MENPKTINKFNQKHDSLRRFLRLISYGCYHRKLFARHGIRERTYDDELRQMRFFISPENIRISHHSGRTYITFQGTSYTGTENYLANSFFLKSLLPDACLHYILLLQTIAQAGKALSLPEILQKTEDCLMKHDPDLISGNKDLSQLLRRRAKELSEVGLLVPEGKGKQLRYGAAPRVLDGLGADETFRLLLALQFYRNTALITMPGYLLTANLKEGFSSPPDVPRLFQFKNNSFSRILDDDMLLVILQAIKDGQHLRIERDNKPVITVAPIAIHTDFHYNRRYLIAMKQVPGKHAEPVSLRVDNIRTATPVNGTPFLSPPSAVKPREIHLKVTFSDAKERSRYEVILYQKDMRILAEEPLSFYCAIPAQDPLQLYPWLWSLQPWAEILPGADGLRERMKQDIRKALLQYNDA